MSASEHPESVLAWGPVAAAYFDPDVVVSTPTSRAWVDTRTPDGKVGYIQQLNDLPKLQISDESSPSKPDNFRVSPATAASVLEFNGISRSKSLSPPPLPPPPPTRRIPLAEVGLSQDSDVTSQIPATSTSSAEEPIEAVLKDWSGRGAHVDYQHEEQVPLVQGRFLGHGSMGSVFETTIRGHAFALKKRFCRRRIGEAERKEIEILKKVSHHHIIQLAGSYTHRQFLGLLLYPVATCDLATFFEDAEALFGDSPWDFLRWKRFEAFGIKLYDMSYICTFIRSQIGCIVSAVEYLHDRKIRHKDLKPSNILLSRNGLWLTDFGTATDFSDRTVSTTDNCERGTPKYFAPEMAAFEKCGRSADIFSLGCVLLEMYTLQQGQTLQIIRELRPKHDKSFQSNLDHINEYLSGPLQWKTLQWETPIDYSMRHHIKEMLARDPNQRPTVGTTRNELLRLERLQDHSNPNVRFLFKYCCRDIIMSGQDYDRQLRIAKQSGADEARLAMQKEIKELEIERDNLRKHVADLEGKVDQQVQSLNAWVQRDAFRLGEQSQSQPATNISNNYVGSRDTAMSRVSKDLLKDFQRNGLSRNDINAMATVPPRNTMLTGPTPLWQPEASAAGSKAALLAHRDGPKLGEQKPPKRLASCEACSRAKVKCDKVRPTCHRCGNMGIYCNYTRALVATAEVPTRKAPKAPKVHVQDFAKVDADSVRSIDFTAVQAARDHTLV